MNMQIAHRTTGLCGLATAAFLVGLASNAVQTRADTITLAPVDYETRYYVDASDAKFDQDTTHSGSPVSVHHTTNGTPYPGTANLDLDGVGSPLPKITISTSATGSGRVSATTDIRYQFYIESSPGSTPPDPTVPVAITFKGSQSVNNVSISNYNQSDISVSIAGDGYQESYAVEDGHYPGANHSLDGGSDDSFIGSTSFDVTNTRNLKPDTLYSVHLYAASASDPDGVVKVSVDPYIEIDPGFASKYQLVFSAGISNSPATAPIPATLPLFVSAIGGLGFLGYRRRRQALTA